MNPIDLDERAPSFTLDLGLKRREALALLGGTAPA